MCMRSRLQMLFGLSLVVLLLVVAQQPVRPQAREKVVYFAAIAPEGSEFWGKIRRGAEDASKATGLKMIWTSGPSVISVEETVNRMETAIAAKPDVLVVSVIDPAAMLPVVRRAVQQGITVFNINTTSRSPNPPYLLYVGRTSDSPVAPREKRSWQRVPDLPRGPLAPRMCRDTLAWRTAVAGSQMS